ncbi:MAG: All-trans-retinol 13,14-reductase [Myxococcaceae bacterium]|nr:All-trans-retinol 13,14-reductase [Myxococcaceae bacterium]
MVLEQVHFARHPGVSWKQQPPSGAFDAIVIGSGVGGLSCASALARYADRRVLVLERHYRIGGYTQTFTRPGYEWDIGVHYIGQMAAGGDVRRLFERLTDGSVLWSALPKVYDRVVLGDLHYDFVAGQECFINRLTHYFPGEGQTLRRYFALIAEANEGARNYYVERMLPKWLAGITGPLLRRQYLRWARRTTGQVLSGLTRNEELAAVLCGQLGDYGLPPSRSSFAAHAGVVNHYIQGAWYPAGGSAAIARAFAPVIEQAGGVLCHSAEVETILIEKGRAVGVRLTDGAELRAPIVVSDAGVANTYGTLLPQAAIPAGFRKELRLVAPSVGYLSLFVGLKHTDAELGTTGTNLWIHPDRNHDRNSETFLRDPARPFPVVYVGFPSAKDPSWSKRFPGRATIEVIAPYPYAGFRQWRDTSWQHRGDGYAEVKEALSQKLLEVLFKQLPQLRGKIDVTELSTPISTGHFVGHPRGELYGLDHTPARFEARLRAQSPVPGLYLTGADLASAGVGGAMAGGALTASAIEGFRLLWKVMA